MTNIISTSIKYGQNTFIDRMFEIRSTNRGS